MGIVADGFRSEGLLSYLKIEQAWLQLAPDINSDSKKAGRPSAATECEGGL